MRSLTGGLTAWALPVWVLAGVVCSSVAADERTGGGPPGQPAPAAEANDEKQDQEPGREPPPPGPRERRGLWGGTGGLGPPPTRGPMGRRFGGPPGDVAAEPLPPEAVEELMEFARINFPELHERLASLRQTDPRRFEEVLRQSRGPLAEIMRKLAQDPHLRDKIKAAHQEYMELRKLAMRYHTAKSDAERQEIRGTMREHVTRQVERRLQAAREEIRRLEERLAKARQELTEQEGKKEVLIGQEVERLTTRPEDDRFPPGPDRRRPFRPPFVPPEPGPPFPPAPP